MLSVRPYETHKINQTVDIRELSCLRIVAAHHYMCIDLSSVPWCATLVN